MRCHALTKKKEPCPLDGATRYSVDGQHYCHVHHPDGVFQRQQREKLTARSPRELMDENARLKARLAKAEEVCYELNVALSERRAR